MHAGVYLRASVHELRENALVQERRVLRALAVIMLIELSVGSEAHYVYLRNHKCDRTLKPQLERMECENANVELCVFIQSRLQESHRQRRDEGPGQTK